MLDNTHETLILMTDKEYNKLSWSERTNYCHTIAKHVTHIRNIGSKLNDVIHDEIWRPAIKHDQKNPEHQSLTPIRDLIEKIHELTQTNKEEKPC